jgi:asparagine synthase (glutamine-hydrolysing)
MCGIAGIAGRDAEQHVAVLERMSQAIAHRGPDDKGLWSEAGVAIANRRLQILDLTAGGHQPMHSVCGRYVLVYNGEIYNYVEIRQSLEAAGESIGGSSDTAVLLAALRRWGPAVIARLNGMWSFALWDRKERKLFASRDRFGKKPFYYLEHAGRLYFSSEIKSLLAVPGIKPKPSPVAIADFASERISNHGDGSFFNGIQQLEPGHSMTWQDGRVSVEQYWSLLDYALAPKRCADIEEIRELLKSAVDIRLRADTKVGCMLSGGIDSSGITSLAQQSLTSQPALDLFSSTYDPPYEEAAGIEAVRNAYPHTILHEDKPSAEHFWADLSEVIWHQEQPFADASMVAHFGLMRAARGAGVPVLLGGQGGDEVFAGYPGYLWIYLGSRLRRGEVGAFIQFYREASRHQKVDLRSTLLHSLPTSLGRMVKRNSSALSTSWLAPEYRVVSKSVEHSEARLKELDPLDQALLQGLSTRTLPGFLHYDDRNSMAFGVETRQPYLDYRLVEMMFRFFPSQKLKGGIVKPILRQTLEPFVPSSILTRKTKTGYPAPLAAWLRSRPDQLTDSKLIRNCPMLVAEAWLRLARAFLAGDDHQLSATWRGYIIARWFDRFFA